uniref:G_PROTEIN_RECEP_F1_2 domain-containing protein n=1 Tax=Heligmosomoides polygyrus TaxID=6339 RepID=A0A183FPF1_HELPZ
LVSYCAGTAPLIVCQLNVVVFLACIFLAVCTGRLIVCIPVWCHFCYLVSTGCRGRRRLHSHSWSTVPVPFRTT